MPLFAHLPLADLAHVVATMTPRTYDAGQTLVQRGERNGALHVVLDGRLRWELPSGQLAHLERGNGIGTTTLVTAHKSPGTLTAELRCRVLELGSEAFRGLCRLRPRLGVQLLTALANQLGDFIDPEADGEVGRPPRGLVEY